jgi:hypothetical protein
MKRLTNRVLISQLLPVLKREIQKTVKIDEKDYDGQDCKRYYVDEYLVVWTRWDRFETSRDVTILTVIMRLNGKFDEAKLSAIKQNGKWGDTFHYAKEWRGLGNGFYAEVDANGHIIKGEWD